MQRPAWRREQVQHTCGKVKEPTRWGRVSEAEAEAEVRAKGAGLGRVLGATAVTLASKSDGMPLESFKQRNAMI